MRSKADVDWLLHAGMFNIERMQGDQRSNSPPDAFSVVT